jgi:muramoyltetrapeptide carboxypeptidase
MFADPEVDIVQCADAGFGAAHILPHIDFDIIADNPKAFIGFSDITALHTAMARKTGLITFYGPLLTSLNQADQKRKGFSETEMLRALMSTEPMGEVPRDPDDPYVRTFNSGTATGQLAGGCLWLLNHAIGTPWAPDLAGKVFFFEDVSSAPWFVDAALTQLKQSGMLDEVIAIVIGQMEAVDWREWHDWPQVMSIEDIFEEHLEPLGVPIVYGLPLGHAKYLSTIPLGVTVEVDADAGRVTVTEAALERR